MKERFNRMVGGLTCFEVLSVLSDYLDDELPQEIRGRVEAHLAGCDNCAQFGMEMAGMLAQLRPDVAPAPAEVAARLQRRIEAWWAS